MLSIWSKGSVVIALSILSACGKKGPCGDREVVAEISGNHGHEIKIPPGVFTGALAVKGGSHEHAVILSAANAEALKAGNSASTRTSSVHAHLHEVSFSCPR